MAEVKSKRAAKAAKEFNVGLSTLIKHLQKKGYDIEEKPTSKLTEEMYKVLLKDFTDDISFKRCTSRLSYRYPNFESCFSRFVKISLFHRLLKFVHLVLACEI